MRLARAILILAIVTATPVTLAQARLGFPACKDKAIMSRALDLSDQSDYAAANVIIRRGLKSKDCQFIPADQLVIEETPPLSRVVKAHRRGDPDEYWIMR
ncbi:MAG: hypothetical protein ACM3PD_08100 [Chloroflexota bacterium]